MTVDKPSRTIRAVAIVASLYLGTAGCSAGGDLEDLGAIVGPGATAGAAGTTGESTAGLGGAGFTYPDRFGAAGTGAVVMDSDEACASVVNEAQQVEVLVETEVEVEVLVGEPVALYILLDQSTSMDEPYFPPTKWQVAVNAISVFVNDPMSENLDIALQYFPLFVGQCTGAGYDTPEVPVGRLPDHAPSITNSLARHYPGIESGQLVMSGNTPIEGALNGATSFCARFMQDPTLNPNSEACVAVLVTDGLPTICSQDPAVLTGIAANALASQGVRTFAIGMQGADFALLDLIAQAGSGDCTPDPADPTWACNVSSTGGTTFIDALNQIRETVTELRKKKEFRTETQVEVLQCNWEIPPPPPDEEFNRDEVNVQFSPTGADADNQIIGRVVSREACRDYLAWYYDDPTTPTQIIACPKTCEMIQAAETGKVNILLGCGTLIL